MYVILQTNTDLENIVKQKIKKIRIWTRVEEKLEIRPRARGTEVHFPEHTERTDH